MAEGGNVPELGGYDYEFTSKVPEDWECLVCHLTMKDPVQIVGCGHRLCNICMESLFRHLSPTCPADRRPLSRNKIFPDAACHRKILDLTVTCPHVGCSWTGELRAVEKHQSECPFKVVNCTNSGCTEEVIMRDLHGHVEFECSWRNVNCEYCQESFIMNQKQEHFDACPKFPVQCTNKCGLRDIPREKVDVHIRDECPATEVQCEYKNLGCEEKFPRSNAKSHSESQVKHHLNLAIRGLEATQLQVNELVDLGKIQAQRIDRMMTTYKEQSQQIERLMTKDKERSQQMERLMCKNTQQAQQIKALLSKDNAEKQSQQIEQLMSKVKEQSQQIERHEQIIKMFSPFEWKIPNFKALRAGPLLEYKMILSEPFYLFNCSYHGYRYSMKIKVRRTMFQLFIRVIPGEYDSLLSWPCKEKVRVSLFDQDPCQDNREHMTYNVDFEDKEKPCTRPIAEDTHRYRCVIYLANLTLETRSYINNDTILIMVSIK